MINTKVSRITKISKTSSEKQIKVFSKYFENLLDITNINVYSPSFDFLNNEPDLYNVKSKKK